MEPATKAMANKELLRLIENEISIGFTFLDSHMLAYHSGHTAHAEQALQNAMLAHKTAGRFLPQLPEAQAAAFRPRLRELASSIARLGGETEL